MCAATSDLSFGLLGPLQVLRDGTPVPIPAAKQRVLLAALLVEPNRVVPVGRLVSRIWDTDPPKDAANTVRVYVLRLRRALAGADEPTPVQTHPEGYLLTVPAAAVDMHRFADLAERGRTALADGDAAAAADHLRAALLLRRGEPFADVPSRVLREQVGADLAERHLAAVELWVDAEMQLGRHEALIPELRELAGSHPLREPVHARLMLALHRGGRRADALEVYERLRAALAEELGIDPCSAVQELHLGILRAAADLDPPPAPPANPPTGAPTPPGQLPAPVARLRGRDSEIAALDHWLAGADAAGTTAPVAAIVGPGGIGKTALAVAWAHRIKDRFPDGHLYLDLCGYGPDPPVLPAVALDRLLRALGVPSPQIPPELAERAALFRSRCAGRRLVIVLDNAFDSGQVRPLLPGPGGVVLVTGRSQLRGLTAREHAFRLSPQPLDVEAGRLLVEDATGQPADTDTVAALPALTGACAGLPLALRIVAEHLARCPHDLSTVLAELRDNDARLGALTAGDDEASDVRSVLSWSYRRLDPAVARAFRLLGTHPGPDVGLTAAAVLLRCSEPTARSHLDKLIDAHLLDAHRPGRYRMHDLLRSYAAELARTDPADTAEVRRTVDWYLGTASAARLRLNPRPPGDRVELPTGVEPGEFGDTASALEWFDAEHAVLVAVADHAVEVGCDDHVWKFAWALWEYLFRRKLLDPWLRLQQAGLAAARRAGSEYGEMQMLDGLCSIYLSYGRLDAAVQTERAALAIAEAGPYPYRKAGILNNLATVYHDLDEYGLALDCYEQSLQQMVALGNRNGEITTLTNIGELLADLGRFREGIEHLDRARDLMEHGSDRHRSAILDHLGVCYAGLGEHQTALAFFRDSLTISQQHGFPEAGADALIHIADILNVGGESPEADECRARARELYQALGTPSAHQRHARLFERGRG